MRTSSVVLFLCMTLSLRCTQCGESLSDVSTEATEINTSATSEAIRTDIPSFDENEQNDHTDIGYDSYDDYREVNNSVDINNSSDAYGHDNYEEEYYYDEFTYPGFSFERPVYLYVWEILVILSFLVNIAVMSVLLQRKMRNATNMIFTAIAISDSLTGLVTLPTYIMVFMRYDPIPDSFNDFSAMNKSASSDYIENVKHYEDGFQYDSNASIGHFPFQGYPTIDSSDGYLLSKSLCEGFMISKFFLSKSFHAASIFLTLFLAVQRYVSVAFPFKSQSIFTVKNTICCCVLIFCVSPALHSFHILKEKAHDGMCQWELSGPGCGKDCVYLWILFIIRHFIPCFVLTVFTILFIKHIRLGATTLQRMDSNASQVSKRKTENRRIMIIVTAIVVVFLVPEIPYGIFLFYSAIDKTLSNGIGIDLKRNRAIHMAYELSLLLSFNANFYIYTFLNKRFRKCLVVTFLKPVQRFIGMSGRFSVTSLTSSASRKATKRTDCDSLRGAIAMKDMRTSTTEKSVTMETKLMQSVSVDITKSSSNSDRHEADKLSANV